MSRMRVLPANRATLAKTMTAAMMMALGACGGQQTPTNEAPTNTPVATPAVADDAAPAAEATDAAVATPATPATTEDASTASSTSSASTATPAADAGAPTAAADAGPPPAAYSGPPPWINLRPAVTTAGIAPDAASRVFRRNQSQIATCYTQQLAANAHAHGTLTIRMSVIAGGVGTVNGVTFAPHNDALTACVRNAVSSWTWPNPRNTASSDVTLTVDLAPTAPAAVRPH